MNRNYTNLIAIAILLFVPVARLCAGCFIQKPLGSHCNDETPIAEKVNVGAGDETVSCLGTSTDSYPDIDAASNSGLNSWNTEQGTECTYSCTAFDTLGGPHQISRTPGNLRFIVAGSSCVHGS
jgi:hypothetical protein